MSHSTDICRGAGLGKYYPECPFRDGTFAYYTEREPIVEDNLQGVGPFLLAWKLSSLKNWKVFLHRLIGRPTGGAVARQAWLSGMRRCWNSALFEVIR